MLLFSHRARHTLTQTQPALCKNRFFDFLASTGSPGRPYAVRFLSGCYMSLCNNVTFFPEIEPSFKRVHMRIYFGNVKCLHCRIIDELNGVSKNISNVCKNVKLLQKISVRTALFVYVCCCVPYPDFKMLLQSYKLFWAWLSSISNKW